MFERESLYQMLAVKDWDGIANVLYKYKDELASDPVTKQAVHLFESEFFNDLETKDDDVAIRMLELPHLIVQQNKRTFDKAFSERVIVEKVRRLVQSGKKQSGFNVAAQHPSLDKCKEIIAQMAEEQPELVANTSTINSRVTATRVEHSQSATRPLFRSRQEENFYLAMRTAFPNHLTYPNVALNAVLEFEDISDRLGMRERDFFFRAMIDNVVFEPGGSYKPLYFFELDSAYHDNEQQKRRDEMKDSIFEVANTKLYRIRPTSKRGGTLEEFQKLILQLMRDA